MKLIRFGKSGQEQPGLVLADGRRVDASEVSADYDEAFFANGGLERLRAWKDQQADAAPPVPDEARLGPPLHRPSKIVCIGLNFHDHAREADMEIPAEPVIFCKASSALAGPHDDVIIPRGAAAVDWEVELAVVIGREASYLEEAEAMDYVAGYVLHNDYSERDFQLKGGGQWVKGKSCDTFASMGPFLVTKDEIDNPGRLGLWLKVNGETKQESSTANFIFDLPEVISYLSQFMSLLPGDVISTGTPAGVGMGQSPPQYLEDGDEVAYGIDGLGEARQRLRAYDAV
jgi:2-keto-4-pentenoate hydratase/2-oxohepta-3-ene-1,7-dioic acid hydratase in catechol pathway